MTKLAPEWVRTSDPVIRSPARYRWTTAPAYETTLICCYNNYILGTKLAYYLSFSQMFYIYSWLKQWVGNLWD